MPADGGLCQGCAVSRSSPGGFSAVREPSTGPTGDQVVDEQQDGRTGDRGDPGGGVEESLQGVVVQMEDLGGGPTAEQRPGDADQAGDDEALRSLAGDQHIGNQACAQAENDPCDD